jgi:hypothetical protein
MPYNDKSEPKRDAAPDPTDSAPNFMFNIGRILKVSHTVIFTFHIHFYSNLNYKNNQKIAPSLLLNIVSS